MVSYLLVKFCDDPTEIGGNFSAQVLQGASYGYVFLGLKTLETNSNLAHASKNFKT